MNQITPLVAAVAGSVITFIAISILGRTSELSAIRDSWVVILLEFCFVLLLGVGIGFISAWAIKDEAK